MSEDKMREYFERKHESFVREDKQWIMYGYDEGVKACAAIKDAEITELKLEIGDWKLTADANFNSGEAVIKQQKAEIAEIKKIAIYNTKEFGSLQEKYKFERQLLDGQIAARDLMIKELREALESAKDFICVNNMEDSVEVELITEALAKSEHRNSRALEKMLLEARIDELNNLQHPIVQYVTERIKQYEAKLAELNKE